VQVYAKQRNIPQDLVVEPHAVLVVGWDDEQGWLLVRNSWGSWPGGQQAGLLQGGWRCVAAAAGLAKAAALRSCLITGSKACIR
jgi:hypothetical protein